jgi:hypothetical protein
VLKIISANAASLYQGVAAILLLAKITHPGRASLSSYVAALQFKL